MISSGADSKLFEEIIRDLLNQGLNVRFQARGASMSPSIRDGDIVEVTPVIVSKLRKDDIVLAKTNNGFRLHRIVFADSARDAFITRGDCGLENDPEITGAQILGLAQAKEMRVGQRMVSAKLNSVSGSILCSTARAQRVAERLVSKAIRFTGRRNGSQTTALLLAILFVGFCIASSSAQVAVDATTSSSAALTGTGIRTLTFAHTTTATANRILIVGVSMNITNNSATVVSGVTYNGTAMTLIGADNDNAGTRRVEMWSLLAPASGARNVIVSVNIPSGVTIGVVAGATSFTGVDQTVPLGTFVSADGAAGACTGIATGCSALDVPSVVNGMILDTLSTDGTQTITAANPQVSQWNARSANTANPGVRGNGTSRTGAPSVPISETFSGTSNWALGAVSINPSTADIAVSTSVSAVALGQNSTYNIKVTNNGPSAANNVILTDTYASTGLAVVSVTPSAGTCVTGATIVCTLPTPLASGTTVTVAVTVSTTTAGFYPNTATITDSGTPPDPNTGNNSYVALAPVVSIVCGNGTLTAGGTLSGVLNTYFPGTASVAAGAKSISIGASTGAGGTIATGSLLLVIQMQDASINTTNSVVYGNGSTGAGFTTINNAGNYEFVTATGPVSGGAVPIAGAGPSGGLVFGYTSAALSATKGRSTFQVVLVPQFTSATLGAATASAWNGSTGGVLAIDVAGQLDLGGATASVDGLGFRGGAGMQLQGGTGANTDYRRNAPATYGGTAQAGGQAPKGEGVAGTPAFVESGGTFLATSTGYPSGTAGTDGSMARGAPGNAGGGGTDADPNGANPGGNDENAGGGGGGNGGSGGFGGDSWNTNLSIGGEGGVVFPATIDRLAFGGGGGAGTRNNSDGDNQASAGAAGGGIIFIRAYNFIGSGTLTANGASAYNGTANDAGGGGGAGGTIVVLSANGGESGLTLRANGGRGGDAWDAQVFSLADRHGPGGGGGGGVVFVSGTPAGMSVSGGASGTTLNPGVAYGATAGGDGTTSASATLGQVTGIQSSAFCASDMTLSKSHAGNFTRGLTASYTIPTSNVSLYGATSGVVTMNDTLPIGITPTSATGTGWSCSVSGQTVSCVRADAVAPAGSYPSITVNVSRAADRSGYGDEYGHCQRRRRGQLTQRHGQRRSGGGVQRRHRSHEFSVSESGDSGFQHYLHAGCHQQRSERRRQCAVGFCCSGQHNVRLHDASRRMDLSGPRSGEHRNRSVHERQYAGGNVRQLHHGREGEHGRGKRHGRERYSVCGIGCDRSDLRQQFRHRDHSSGWNWAKFDRDRHCLTQSGAGRSQHHLYAGRDQYRIERHHQRHIFGVNPDQHHVRFNHAASGMDLHRIPHRTVHQSQRSGWRNGDLHCRLQGECWHGEWNRHHRYRDGQCDQSVIRIELRDRDRRRGFRDSSRSCSGHDCNAFAGARR